MGGFSAGDILFILLVGGIICGLMVLVSMIRNRPDASDEKEAPEKGMDED